MNKQELKSKIREIKALLNSMELKEALNEFFLKEETESNEGVVINELVEIADYLQTRTKRRKKQAKKLFQMIEGESVIVKCLEQYLIEYLQEQHLERLETVDYDLEIVSDNSQEELIIDENISITDVPEEYQKLFLEIDRYSVRQALESGEELDFARLKKQELKLKITS